MIEYVSMIFFPVSIHREKSIDLLDFFVRLSLKLIHPQSSGKPCTSWSTPPGLPVSTVPKIDSATAQSRITIDTKTNTSPSEWPILEPTPKRVWSHLFLHVCTGPNLTRLGGVNSQVECPAVDRLGIRTHHP